MYFLPITLVVSCIARIYLWRSSVDIQSRRSYACFDYKYVVYTHYVIWFKSNSGSRCSTFKGDSRVPVPIISFAGCSGRCKACTVESTMGFPLSRKCRRSSTMMGRFMFTAHCFRRTTRDCFYVNTSKCYNLRGGIIRGKSYVNQTRTIFIIIFRCLRMKNL
ncbi:uncharacterized protein LOC122572485 [Bombus pyrosoma]|uniref:uncharacterized protein LOC122572485 n=1 Tax=Bombus pyrosoma TaxID=396416 RepID=UPI001CB8D79C|nr:uncharacterized protein LOC122572485 [Bombus pyrosoma]